MFNSKRSSFLETLLIATLCLGGSATCRGQGDSAEDYAQPLSSNVVRLLETLETIHQPLQGMDIQQLQKAIHQEKSSDLEKILDAHILATVTINPESKVKVEPGPVEPILQQGGFVSFLVKIVNLGRVKSSLQVTSPQAGPTYAGVTPLSMERQDQRALRDNEAQLDSPRRFLVLEWYQKPPMTSKLSGVEVEYCLLSIYSSDEGQREAVLEFSVGQGTQDLGFRAQIPILFQCRRSVPVPLAIRDVDGEHRFARLAIRDRQDRVYPPQVRRLAPDFFFQEHVYRCDGEWLHLPEGEYSIEVSRGPEYKRQIMHLTVDSKQANKLEIDLQRWVDPQKFGWYSGDHHIHGAGCAHYESPTKGVTPKDMFRQVSGEGLHVGCVLTWGPCFEHQREFFRPEVDAVSGMNTILKYDLEVSGFGSQALGHVCLLNLRNQDYPGSDGTKEKGWPTWATPVLRWAKDQGAITGFAHSASGLQIDPERASQRLVQQFDRNHDGILDRDESSSALLPDLFESIDRDKNQLLSSSELQIANDLAADRLPNTAIPEMDSVGAMELPVAVTQDVCDFISAMDTPRIAEWNMWYHMLNCGFDLKVSGETDFPCMSGTSVGQGRSYVFLGDEPLSFETWCRNLAQGRCYVSDGYAHALQFEATCGKDTARVGEKVSTEQPTTMRIHTKVAFAPEVPRSVAYGNHDLRIAPRWIGDTVNIHSGRSRNWVRGDEKLVELVVNGKPVRSIRVPADGREHDLDFQIDIQESSWLAIRCFPQLHTNTIEVLIGGKPIRVSSESARWCEEVIHQLWRTRAKSIRPTEFAEAEKTFHKAIEVFRNRAKEAAH